MKKDLRFSERVGAVQVRRVLQHESMDATLRTGLWNLLWDQFFRSESGFIDAESLLYGFSQSLWLHHREPLDESPNLSHELGSHVKHFVSTAEWHAVYDFLEWLVDFSLRYRPGSDHDRLLSNLNQILEENMSSYRVVGTRCVAITSEVEIQAVESALIRHNPAGTPDAASQHIARGLELLASRPPDSRNSIKESISAVEFLCRALVGADSKDPLGAALSKVYDGSLHPALRKGLSNLYGFASDESGIRHALTDDGAVTSPSEAKLMLIICSAIVNFISESLAGRSVSSAPSDHGA